MRFCKTEKRRSFISHTATILYCLVMFFFLVADTVAQNAVVRHYTAKDGLPSSIVYRCAQDHRGFMWFGTESGISRFDGKNFRNFSIPDGLTETEILDIFCAANGELWLIPFGGNPMRFDPLTEKCHTAATDPELKKIVYRGILNISQLRNGDILFSYLNNAGLYRYSKGKVSEIPLPPGSNGNIKSVYELQDDQVLLNIPNSTPVINVQEARVTLTPNIDGEVAAITGDTVFSFNNKKGFLFASRLSKGWSAVKYDSIKIDQGNKRINAWGGLLYLCDSRGGVHVYDLALRKINTLFPDELFNTSFADRDGNLWLCSNNNGVYNIPVSKVRYFNRSSGLTGDYVSSLLPLPGNGVLTGFSNGTMNLVNTETGDISRLFSEESGTLSNRIRKIISTRNGGIMAISDRSLVYSDGRLPLRFTSWSPYGAGGLGGKDISEYLPGQFLVANTNHLLLADPERGVLDTFYVGRTTSVEAGTEGDAWFCTINGVYYSKNIRTRQYEYIGNRDTLLTRRMNNMVLAPDGLLWMATANTGVLVLQNNKVIARLTTMQGMASDLCRNVFPEKDTSRVWVATNNGISSITYGFRQGEFTYSIRNYNASDGLPDNDVQKVSLAGGKVIAATASGLLIFEPHATQQTIPVHIVEVQVEGKKQPVNESFSLRYFQNDISISFTGICFTCGGNLPYEYRMLSGGSDTTWINTESQQVNFSALRPGRYTFQVRTATGKNITSIFFYIKRPWYIQWWFFMLVAIVAVVTMALVYRRRIRNIEEKAKQAQQMAQLEMQALQAQMNPHFIFNSLNSINHFIAENDSARAQNYLGSFSRLMRLFLESSRSKYISIAQEKELLSLYLQLEQLRFNNRFTYSVEIDPLLNTGHEIPSMLVQPFVENSVNHGLFNKPGADGFILVRFYREDSQLCCRVEDNGIGRAAAALLRQNTQHISRSMQITEERLKTLEQSTGTKTHILVQDKYDDSGNAAGTIVIIRITEQEEQAV